MLVHINQQIFDGKIERDAAQRTEANLHGHHKHQRKMLMCPNLDRLHAET